MNRGVDVTVTLREVDQMSEAEEAWRLCELLRGLSELLWERYQSAFMDFQGEAAGAGRLEAPRREDEFGGERMPF